jgi:hypothetical protein
MSGDHKRGNQMSQTKLGMPMTVLTFVGMSSTSGYYDQNH